jgi:hypothetical protein
MRRFEQFGIGCNPVAKNEATDRSRDCNDAIVEGDQVVVN